MLNEEKDTQVQKALINASRKRIEFWELVQKFLSEHKDDIVYDEKFIERRLSEYRMQLKLLLVEYQLETREMLEPLERKW